MSAVYTVGADAVARLLVTNSAGDPVTATVTCQLTEPDGDTSSLTPTESPTGTFTVRHATTLVGIHSLLWTADDGTTVFTFEDVFNVESDISAPVSLTDVKGHLNISTTDSDQELVSFINAATAAIESRVGPLTRRSVTETHNGGSSWVLLNQAPIISVTSVTENGTAVTGYSVSTDAGILTRTSGYSRSRWTDGYGNVTITYEAGRQVIPADLRQAVLEQIRHMWETQRGQQRGRRDGDSFVAGQGYTFSNRVLQLIGPYERAGIA